jgi:hypothetical protein
MAECSRCGANTDIHLIGIPICLRCDEIVELMAADLNSKNATPELFLVKIQSATA